MTLAAPETFRRSVGIASARRPIWVRTQNTCAAPAAKKREVSDFPERSFSSEIAQRSEEHTSELQSRLHLVCRLLLEKKKPNLSMDELKVAISPESEILGVNNPFNVVWRRRLPICAQASSGGGAQALGSIRSSCNATL